MEARELTADLMVLLADLALAARELAAELGAELAAVLALDTLSVSPSSILTLPSSERRSASRTGPNGGSGQGTDRDRRARAVSERRRKGLTRLRHILV